MTELITKYSGDEGRDRIHNPSANAPHTPAEAQRAVIQSAKIAVLNAHRREPHTTDPYTRRTALQAQWLNDAEEIWQPKILAMFDTLMESVPDSVPEPG